MNSRNERLVANQHSSRYANERLQGLAADLAEDDQLIPFLCECADQVCLGRVEMKRADYDEIHLDPDLYAIVRGHAMADGEQVVERRDGFDVVVKA